jgi:hypothetical protein
MKRLETIKITLWRKSFFMFLIYSSNIDKNEKWKVGKGKWKMENGKRKEVFTLSPAGALY